MRKRERENPCSVCGHYHKYEEGEVCGICGHRSASSAEKTTTLQVSAFPSEILPDFLYLGSYDNASRSGLLKTQGISRVLNTVPSCQNLYKNSFTYHCLEDDKILQFDDAIQFLEQCERDKARVLVHCMFGKNRLPIILNNFTFLDKGNYKSKHSTTHTQTQTLALQWSAAIVIAYLMKCKGWRLAQSHQWVKERRPSVNLTEDVHQQLQEYEQKIFGSVDGSNPTPLPALSAGMPSFSFGFPKGNNDPVPVPVPAPVPAPAFNTNFGATSIFAGRPSNVPTQGFTFGAGQTDISQTSLSGNIPNPNGSDIPMDSS
ncbi:protein-tyrosine-phosphatase IBR5 [Citrus sinensis]|uniref:Protein-tyrosine-phosphatase IBR5 n=1 Tax=Citrus sinensis TaxID=2711 RepID=A0ACB8N6G1_CITSI|nr:protein-tyrosine-phosphatase IBR5 [Citrus sinensis]